MFHIVGEREQANWDLAATVKQQNVYTFQNFRFSKRAVDLISRTESMWGSGSYLFVLHQMATTDGDRDEPDRETSTHVEIGLRMRVCRTWWSSMRVGGGRTVREIVAVVTIKRVCTDV